MPTGQYHRKWEWLAQQLRDRIDSGEWGAGDWMPSQYDIGRRYKSAYPTVARALDQLAKEGLITATTQGRRAKFKGNG